MPLSKRNRKGIVLLFAITLAIILTPRIYSVVFLNEPPILTFSEVAAIEKDLIQKIETNSNSWKSTKKSKYVAPSQKFDPNKYSAQDWESLGLSPKQASAVINFAKYGISSNEALEKIYVIPKQLFQLIKDSTIYPHKKVKTADRRIKQPKAIPVVKLNTANIEQLDELPGIGEYFATKIVDYRIKLGGFSNKEQLLEIWKFESERLEKIRAYITIDRSQLKKLNINTADEKQLASHPYINYKIANSIVKMRNAHGYYKSAKEIKRSKLIDEEMYMQLQPYLSIK